MIRTVLLCTAALLATASTGASQQLRPCSMDGVSAPARCVWVDAPEDHDAPGGRTIALRVVVIPAAASPAAPDPLFQITGGPGQAATDLARAFSRGRRGALANRDVVLVDQRGTGGSNSLRCHEDTSPAGSFGHVLSPDSILKACLADVSTHADPRLYTTTQAVYDLDAVRKALGYGPINLRGASYGTRFVLEYLRRFPRAVRTAELTGVVPTDFKAPLGYARFAQDALDALFQDCADDEACAAAYPHVADEWRKLLARGTVETWVTDDTGAKQAVPLSTGDLAYAVRSMLYGSDALRLPALIHGAATNGEVSPFAQYYWRRERSVWSGISQGLHLSVFCAEDVPFIGDDEARSATAATFMGSYVVDDYRRACRVWPRRRVPDDFFKPVVSDRPVLIISGRRDPSTPPATARRVLATLTHGALVIHRYGGHGFTGSSDRSCQAAISEDFLTRGTVEGLDLSCADKEPPLPFVIGQETPGGG